MAQPKQGRSEENPKEDGRAPGRGQEAGLLRHSRSGRGGRVCAGTSLGAFSRTDSMVNEGRRQTAKWTEEKLEVKVF